MIFEQSIDFRTENLFPGFSLSLDMTYYILINFNEKLLLTIKAKKPQAKRFDDASTSSKTDNNMNPIGLIYPC